MPSYNLVSRILQCLVLRKFIDHLSIPKSKYPHAGKRHAYVHSLLYTKFSIKGAFGSNRLRWRRSDLETNPADETALVAP